MDADNVTFLVPNRQNKRQDHCSLFKMAIPDFPKKSFGLLKGSLPEKNLPWGYQRQIFEKRFFFWKNLVWPFRPVHNTNEKWSFFFSTYWEPQKSHIGIHVWENCSPLIHFINLHSEFYFKFLLLFLRLPYTVPMMHVQKLHSYSRKPWLVPPNKNLPIQKVCTI